MVCKWTDDGQRFILENFDIISNSPSEIYHYALPFSPSNSWLREYYSSEFSQEVKVIKGLQVEWGSCSRTLSLDYIPDALACWKDTIAVGSSLHDITILDAIAGIHTSVISEHVVALTFSSDGTLLVSGSKDRTVSLYDIQTGGIIRTFYGHTGGIRSVSISPDCTMIASGSTDTTIRLWDTWTGVCRCVIDGHEEAITFVIFSPTNSQLLISASWDDTVQQWDISGNKIGSAHEDNSVAFSPDGTHYVSWVWLGMTATVRNSDSAVAVAKLQVPAHGFRCCCFSPITKIVAGCAGYTIYIWDITSPGPHLVKTFTGHTDVVWSITFSSSLISTSWDQSIRFWQIGTLPTDPVTAVPKSMLFLPQPIGFVSL